MEIESVKQKIITKIEKGDLKTLSTILNVPRNTAVSRFNRNNKDAVLCMKKIVANRENFVKKMQKQYSHN
ncbi:hypothetical protein N4T20_02250 [Flavobacterium sp. TR2]|uniref:hypothetical protein n=1 Tax=Flavobacterium sp. TR2 TaxID=2977321 RepID=UPI0021B126D4|nr:hypothetical protein [Flavobacterium sp. TR2]UWY28756.1 hypothetical protein N4T20_02250 [Flavobacterium sp. TR2]